MCCSRIRVTDNQWYAAGTYQKASGLINNRSYWNQIDGDWNMIGGNKALWWDSKANAWTIGSSSNLGSNIGCIKSVQDSACPTSNNRFNYSDGVKFNLAPINSVSIQCV